MNIGNQLILELMMMMMSDVNPEPDDRVPPRPEPIIPIRRVLPPRKRRGKNRKYHSTTPAETSSEEEMTIGHKGRVPKDMEKKKMNTNPPKLCAYMTYHKTMSGMQSAI